jgi:hypothetical protein
LTARRDNTAAEAEQARELASEHKASHGWLSRFLPGATRRRQKALDREADRSERDADRLRRSYKSDCKRIAKESKRQAKVNTDLLEDWTYSKPVSRARKQITVLDQIQAAIVARDDIAITATARGDWTVATNRAADVVRQGQTVADPAPVAQDPRPAAIAALMRAESRVADDADHLAVARQTTAAAMSGDATTVAAAAAGDLDGARQAAAAWHRRQEQARRHQEYDRQQEQGLAVGPAYR